MRYPRGDQLDTILIERGWTSRDLSDIIGYPESYINDVIEEIIPFSFTFTSELEQVFGASSWFWMRREDQ